MITEEFVRYNRVSVYVVLTFQAERPDVLELLSQMARKRQLELQQNQQLELQQQQQQQQQYQQKRAQPVTPSWSDDHRQASPEIGTTTSEDESSRRCNGNSAPRFVPSQKYVQRSG